MTTRPKTPMEERRGRLSAKDHLELALVMSKQEIIDWILSNHTESEIDELLDEDVEENDEARLSEINGGLQ